LVWNTVSGGNLASGNHWSPPSDGDYIITARINAISDLFFTSVILSKNQEKRNPKLLLSVNLVKKTPGQPNVIIPGGIFKQIPYSTTPLIFTLDIPNITPADRFVWVATGRIDKGISNAFPAHGKINPISWNATKKAAPTTLEPNYLFKKLYTFQNSFVYDDFEESALSPISKFNFPVVEMDFDQEELVVAHSNTILLTVETGSSIVTRIKIFAKEAMESEFRLVAELDKKFLGIADNTTHVFKFLNSSASLPVVENESEIALIRAVII